MIAGFAASMLLPLLPSLLLPGLAAARDVSAPRPGAELSSQLLRLESYAGCVYDPSTSAAFQLLDSKTYFPVSKDGDDVILGPAGDNSDTSLLEFRAVNLDSDGRHDITLQVDGQTFFLALLDDSGRLGWVLSDDDSNNDDDDDTIQTHIFTTLCTGGIVARREDDNETQLAIAIDTSTKDITLSAPSSSSQPSTPRTFVILPHSIRTQLLAPSSSPQNPLLNRNDLTNPSRCPDPSLTATHRTDAPAVVPNGCGTASLEVPDFNFGDCCNAHDVCYSTCSTTFDGCNDAFEQCMYDRCDADYDGEWDFVPLGACKAGAFFYASSVKVAGEGAFDAATEVQCVCA